MTESELFSAYFDAVNVVHGNFEFWLSATFAFTLAFHFSGSDMSNFFRKMLMILYFLASVVFISNWASTGILSMNLVSLIETGNPEMAVRPIFGLVIPIVTFCIMVLGTFAALYFAANSSGQFSEDET